jgi:hypothetical protein
MNYKVGEFGEDLIEGKKYNGGFMGHPERSVDPLLFELDRAGMVRALMDAGIVGSRELEAALDAGFEAESRGTHSSGQKRMDTDRGYLMSDIREGEYHHVPFNEDINWEVR